MGEQGGLSRAGRSDDGDHFAAGDRKGDRFEGGHLAFAFELFGDAVEGDGVRVRGHGAIM